MSTHESSSKEAAVAGTRLALHGRVANDLALHKPKDDEAANRLDVLRAEHIALSHLIIDATPICREQSLALTSIEASLQMAIAAIVRHPD